MGRIITSEKIDAMRAAIEADPSALGPTLGVLLIKGNVPIEGAAKLLSVSEQTIYRWMYGQSAPRDTDKIVKIKNFTKLLRKMQRDKHLPLEGTVPARVKDLVALVKEYHVARQQNLS